MGCDRSLVITNRSIYCSQPLCSGISWSNIKAYIIYIYYFFFMFFGLLFFLAFALNGTPFSICFIYIQHFYNLSTKKAHTAIIPSFTSLSLSLLSSLLWVLLEIVCSLSSSSLLHSSSSIHISYPPPTNPNVPMMYQPITFSQGLDHYLVLKAIILQQRLTISQLCLHHLHQVK